jgi:hypothetical protein
MMHYGMAGNIAGGYDGDDSSRIRVVAWDLDRCVLEHGLLERDVQRFVPGFKVDMDASREGVVGYKFTGGVSSNTKCHVLDVVKHWLVYSFDSGRLMKIPVMDMLRFFTRAI